MESNEIRQSINDSLRSELKIVVVDYQSGNLRSVAKALEIAGVKAVVSDSPHVISSADAVVLPGVGSGKAAMDALTERELIVPLCDFVDSGRPFLGICLGLQLLMDKTEEGNTICLGVVPGEVKQFPPDLKVPHIGWNLVSFKEEHPVLKDIPSKSYFYFVHSYYAVPTNWGKTLGVTSYGFEFCSVIGSNNLVATQFHPEKSGPEGLKIYRNFVDYSVLIANG